MTSSFSFSLTSDELLKIASYFAEVEGTCLLYSGGQFDSCVHSYLFLFPFERIEIQNEKDGFSSLKEKLQFEQTEKPYPVWSGFFSYEIMDQTSQLKEIPDAYFQKSALVLALNHKTNEATVYLEQDVNVNVEIKKWLNCFSEKAFWLSFIKNLPEIKFKKASFKVVKELELIDSYIDKIHFIQEKIRDGDVYQVNLSQDAIIQNEENPYSFFERLNKLNPAPFSVYLKHQNFTVISSSPERFLKFENETLETRPIKGTISRGKTVLEDEENRKKLLNSKKDLAELLMITDLMRNDLGKISLPGSVKTLKIAHLEAYSNVYHLLSIIQSKRIPDLHPIDLIKACFPGGSVTGCPKLKAISYIKQLEKRNRGIYTGSIGYFKTNGEFDFNIAIRTFIVSKNGIQIQLGGAITIDSIPEEEYEETLHKGKSIFEILS